MLILAIDTSTRAGSAAALRDSQVLAEVSGLEETPYSIRLFRDVAALRSKAQFGLSDVDLFAVAAGPGSFTGLRVGLTAVKAWAEVHRKPIVAVSGLEAVASQSQRQLGAGSSDNGLIAPFLDARRGYVFGALYRAPMTAGTALELVGEESILLVPEFLQLVRERSSQHPLFVSPTPDAIPVDDLKSVLPTACIERTSAALAVSIGRLGHERAKRGDLVDPVQLDANYVRQSDAEVATKGR